MKKIIVFFIKFIGIVLAAAIGSFCGYFVAEGVKDKAKEFACMLDELDLVTKEMTKDQKDHVVIDFRSKTN